MHWSDEKFTELKAKGFRYAVRPHRPNYVTGFDTPEEIFGANKLQDIFDARYIKQWLDDKAVLVGLEVKYYSYPQRLIRASMVDGSHWVIGYFAELQDYDTTDVEVE